jgi:hypothetical protein
MNSAARHISPPEKFRQIAGRIFVLLDDGATDIDATIARLAVERGLNSLDDVVIIPGSDFPADEDAIRELVRLSTKSGPARAAPATAERARFPKAAAVGLYPLRRTFAFLAESANGNV